MDPSKLQALEPLRAAVSFEEKRIEQLIQATKSREQIAREYGIDVRTLRRRLKRYDLEIPKGFLTPKVQRLIYETFGPPPKV